KDKSETSGGCSYKEGCNFSRRQAHFETYSITPCHYPVLRRCIDGSKRTEKALGLRCSLSLVAYAHHAVPTSRKYHILNHTMAGWATRCPSVTPEPRCVICPGTTDAYVARAMCPAGLK